MQRSAQPQLLLHIFFLRSRLSDLFGEFFATKLELFPLARIEETQKQFTTG